MSEENAEWRSTGDICNDEASQTKHLSGARVNLGFYKSILMNYKGISVIQIS